MNKSGYCLRNDYPVLTKFSGAIASEDGLEQ